MRWVWDEEKNRSNKHDHGLSFETAQLVFNDPLALTMGLVETVLLFVVHTWPDADPATGEETGRIISARKATSHERKAYEEEGTL